MRCLASVLFIAIAVSPMAGQWRNPPVLNNISPAVAAAGSPTFNLTVAGSNLTGRCVVLWNNAKRPTVIINAQQAIATIYSTDVNSPGTAALRIRNTKTGQVSNSLSLTITSSTSSSVAVTVSPTVVSLQTGGTQQFTASVVGTTTTGVTWSTTGGAISSAGQYTAPNTAGNYVVNATSMADATKSASVNVYVTAPPAVTVSLSPTATTLQTTGTQQFIANVSGTTNIGVSWSTTGGTISSGGIYTAPSTAGAYTVTATSVAVPTSSALAYVTVNTPVIATLSASPTSISFGSVVVGSSASQAVTLSNTGNSSVMVSSATPTGSGFSVSGVTFPFTLPAATSKTAILTFAPPSSGTASGSASFVSNATNSPATVLLSGSGTAPLQHSVTLSWQPSTSTVGGYNVYRGGTSGGPYTRLNSVLDPNAIFTDTGVQSGLTYYYVVTSTDTTGLESGYSNQVTAVIPTP